VIATKPRPGAASDSRARNFGCVMTPTAREWPAKYASSSALDRAFVVTATAPRMPQPNHANSASGQFSRWMSTRSPGRTPRRTNPAATRSARATNSP
jgi:hypothetical protein